MHAYIHTYITYIEYNTHIYIYQISNIHMFHIYIHIYPHDIPSQLNPACFPKILKILGRPDSDPGQLRRSMPEETDPWGSGGLEGDGGMTPANKI